MDVSEKVFVVVVLYQGLKKYRQRENTDNIEQSCSPTRPVPTANLAAAGERGVSWNGKTLAALKMCRREWHYIYGMLSLCGVVANVVKCQCVKKNPHKTWFYGTASLIIIQFSALSFPFSTFPRRKMYMYMMRNVFVQLRYAVLYEYEQWCQTKWSSLNVY